MGRLMLLLATFLGLAILSRKPAAQAHKTAGAFPFPTSSAHTRIVLDEAEERERWCASLGCSEGDLRAAVRAVGLSENAVRDYLGRQGTIAA